jgi:hypothetical protein
LHWCRDLYHNLISGYVSEVLLFWNITDNYKPNETFYITGKQQFCIPVIEIAVHQFRVLGANYVVPL